MQAELATLITGRPSGPLRITKFVEHSLNILYALQKLFAWAMSTGNPMLTESIIA